MPKNLPKIRQLHVVASHRSERNEGGEAISSLDNDEFIGSMRLLRRYAPRNDIFKLISGKALKRRLSRCQNLGVIGFFAERRHVSRVDDLPGAVDNKGRPAQEAHFLDETTVFRAEIGAHVV